MNAHSYLYLHAEPDPALTRFIATAAAAATFMKGEQGGPLPGWHTAGRDNHGVLQSLHDALARRYPEAGKPLWAVRMWTNLTWQPAYLAVLAVHLHGALPDFTGVSQKVIDHDIDGYRLKAGPQQTGDVFELIDLAGARLRETADAMLEEVNAIIKLKPLPAKRLLADRMLGLMTRLARMRPELPAATIRAYSDRWLAAMGLTGQGDLETLHLHDGREVLTIARKGCCLDYLIEPAEYCASCPKQDDAVRVARQRADALAG